MPLPKKGLRQKIALLLFGQILLLAALAMGVSYEVRLVEQKINDLSEMKDPSPFRAVLLGQLNQINVNLLSYIQSRDAAPLEQIVKSEKEFEKSADDFKTLNPRLFPLAAQAKILEAYRPFKETVEHILEASTQQAQRGNSLAENESRLMALIDRRLRPLARGSEKRLDLVSTLQSQLRQAPKELTQNKPQLEQTLRSYRNLASQPNEQALLKLIERLWTENVAYANDILDLERVRTEAFTQILQRHQNLEQTLSDVLPAVRPEVMEAQQRSMFHAIVIMIALSAAMLLVGVASGLASAFWITRALRRPSTLEPDAQILLGPEGKITAWNTAAERLYGYKAKEILGRSISTLFASEDEIGLLYKKMKDSRHARFDALHVTRDGTRIKVHLTFEEPSSSPEQANGIRLSIYPLTPSAQ